MPLPDRSGTGALGGFVDATSPSQASVPRSSRLLVRSAIRVVILAFVLMPYATIGGMPVSYVFATAICVLALGDLALRPPSVPIREKALLAAIAVYLFMTMWNLCSAVLTSESWAAFARSTAAGAGLLTSYLVILVWAGARLSVSDALRTVAHTMALASALAVLGWFLRFGPYVEVGGYWGAYLPARVRGGFASPNFLGGALVIGILAALGAEHRRPKLIAVLTIPQLLCLLLTFTRGSWFGLLVGIGALVVLSRHVRRMIVPLATLLAAVGFVVLMAQGLLGGVLTRVSSSAIERAIQERTLTFESGFRLVADHPLFGVGPGAVSDVIASSSRYIRMPSGANVKAVNPHNSYLLTASSAGLPAAFSAVALSLFALIWSWRQMRRGRAPIGAFPLLLGFLSQNMTNNLILNPQVMFLLCLVLGALLAVRLRPPEPSTALVNAR